MSLKKEKDFQLRQKKNTRDHENEIKRIDEKYDADHVTYLDNQLDEFTKALVKWGEDYPATLLINDQMNTKLEEKIKEAKKDGKWLWKATLESIGNKNLMFDRLDYNAETEVFDYQVRGGTFNYIFMGTINVPIDQAEAFKKQALSDPTLGFQIIKGRLQLTQINDKAYKVNNVSAPTLIDDKELQRQKDEIILAQKRKEYKEKLLEEFKKDDVLYVNGKLWHNTKVPQNHNFWKQAKKYCQNLNYKGIKNWQLPSESEFKSISSTIYPYYKLYNKNGSRKITVYGREEVTSRYNIKLYRIYITDWAKRHDAASRAINKDNRKFTNTAFTICVKKPNELKDFKLDQIALNDK